MWWRASLLRHLCLFVICYVSLIYETTMLLRKLLACVSLRRHLWLRDKCDKYICIVYEVFALECYTMFWLNVHVIDVTICFYEHCIIHMQKVYTWDKSLFSRFLANTIESPAFNRLSRNVYEIQKFWKEKVTKEKFQKSRISDMLQRESFEKNEKIKCFSFCMFIPSSP